MTVSATQALAHELELVVPDAARAKVALDAAVATLELHEHAQHRLGRSRGDPLDPLPLDFRSGPHEPRLVPGPKPFLAQRIVAGDLRVVDAGDVEQHGHEQAR